MEEGGLNHAFMASVSGIFIMIYMLVSVKFKHIEFFSMPFGLSNRVKW